MGHLMTGGENFTDDDYAAVSEITKLIVSLMDMRSGTEQKDADARDAALTSGRRKLYAAVQTGEINP